ncbi:putative SOS response-associated peptidase YedK [Bradyrhizobium japonicum]
MDADHPENGVLIPCRNTPKRCKAPKALLTIPRNRCSRSSEISAHDPLKSALTIPRNAHYPAPIVRNVAGAREIVMARWGMPSSAKALMDATKKRAEKLQAKGKAVDFKELLRLEPDSGTANIRNTSSGHWKRWLGPDNRCLVPLTSFSEYDTIDGKKVPVWFALEQSRPWPLSLASGRIGPACERR